MIADIFANAPHIFPLMRGGGAFLSIIGLGLLIGALRGRIWRLAWLIAGAALGVLAMAAGGITGWIFDGLPRPALWQWGVLGLAFLAEGYLVSVVVRRFPDLDSREFWMWMLFIVGAHFLILGLSHGPICAALGLLCMANAAIGLRASKLDYRLFWAGDGVLKIATGGLMVALSY